MRKSFGSHQGKRAALLFFTISIVACSSANNRPARSDAGGGAPGSGGTGSSGGTESGTGTPAATDGGGGSVSFDGGGGRGSTGVAAGGVSDAGGIAGTGGGTSKPADCGTSGTGARDFQTDNNNCGSCGNVCSAVPPSTAQCSAGRCLTTYVLGSQVVATDFAVDSANVFFATSEAPGVMKVPLDGGPATPLQGTDLDTKRVAVYETDVFYADSRAVHALDPVMHSSWTLSSGRLCEPFNLLGNATSVYWLTGADCLVKSPETDGTLMGATRDLRAPKAQVLASGSPAAFALDATTIYWTVGDSVMKMPLAGGVAMVLTTGQKTPRGIAVDATNVYWNSAGTSETGYADGSVMRIPLGGGTPTVLALAQSKLADIAVDAASVYWSTYEGSSGRIMKLSMGSDTPVTLASGNINATRITVDVTSVYWLSNYEVMRLTPK